MNDKDKIKLDLSRKSILFSNEYTTAANETTAARNHLIEALGFRLVTEYGDLMIPDVTLAKVLGYKQPRSIRRLIVRHLPALAKDGSVRSFIEERSGRGRKREGFLLTMQQALFLMAKSDNPVAEEITVLLVSSAFHRLAGGISPADPNAVRELERERDNYREAVNALRQLH
jgi:phage regulator Rha-like protein